MENYVTQIKIILTIFGDLLIPEKFTELISIIPTNFWNKGDKIPPRKGLIRKDSKVPLRKESAWEYSTGFIKTLDSEEVSKQIDTVFGDKIVFLKQYIKENNLEVVLNVIVEIVDHHIPSIHFNKKMIQLCNELNAEIDIDMYLLDND